jgi:hypothetical protein
MRTFYLNFTQKKSLHELFDRLYSRERLSKIKVAVKALVTAMTWLVSPRLDNSKWISPFTRLCLKFLCDFESIGFLIPEKYDDYLLIIFYQKLLINGF